MTRRRNTMAAVTLALCALWVIVAGAVPRGAPSSAAALLPSAAVCGCCVDATSETSETPAEPACGCCAPDSDPAPGPRDPCQCEDDAGGMPPLSPAPGDDPIPGAPGSKGARIPLPLVRDQLVRFRSAAWPKPTGPPLHVRLCTWLL